MPHFRIGGVNFAGFFDRIEKRKCLALPKTELGVTGVKGKRACKQNREILGTFQPY